MNDIKKGFLLNFAYEGSHIIFKLFLFCLIFYVTQISTAYAIMQTQAQLITVVDGYDAVGFLNYNEFFNTSIIPYILTAFMVTSFWGINHIFKKDRLGSNKLNAIYTWPFPRYCNFVAKLFYCILCPVSVYAVQVLANLTIIQFSIGNIKFRENELFLSSQFKGAYQLFFTSNPVMVFTILIVLALTILFFRNNIFNSIALDIKRYNIYSIIQIIGIVTAINLVFNSNNNQSLGGYFYGISVCIISIIIDIFLSYRKLRV